MTADQYFYHSLDENNLQIYASISFKILIVESNLLFGPLKLRCFESNLLAYSAHQIEYQSKKSLFLYYMYSILYLFYYLFNFFRFVFAEMDLSEEWWQSCCCCRKMNLSCLLIVHSGIVALIVLRLASVYSEQLSV